MIEWLPGEQRFFLSWALAAWKDISWTSYLRQTLLSMPHAPPHIRANGPASNMPAFHEAFRDEARRWDVSGAGEEGHDYLARGSRL